MHESAVHSSDLVQKAVWNEGCTEHPQVLHGDSGSVIKGQTVRVMLGITASFSRPRVIENNAINPTECAMDPQEQWLGISITLFSMALF